MTDANDDVGDVIDEQYEDFLTKLEAAAAVGRIHTPSATGDGEGVPDAAGEVTRVADAIRQLGAVTVPGSGTDPGDVAAPPAPVSVLPSSEEEQPLPRPINTSLLTSTALAEALDECSKWLAWFLPTYRITVRDFPWRCWRSHPAVVEEALGLWVAWQYYLNLGHSTDHVTFNSQVQAWRARLRETYDARCADSHREDVALGVTIDDLDTGN